MATLLLTTHTEFKLSFAVVIFGFSEIAVTEEEDVGIAMIGFRFTDIPQISPQFAAANELYFPNLLTIDTPDSAVGKVVWTPQFYTKYILFPSSG